MIEDYNRIAEEFIKNNRDLIATYEIFSDKLTARDFYDIIREIISQELDHNVNLYVDIEEENDKTEYSIIDDTSNEDSKNKDDNNSTSPKSDDNSNEEDDPEEQYKIVDGTDEIESEENFEDGLDYYIDGERLDQAMLEKLGFYIVFGKLNIAKIYKEYNSEDISRAFRWLHEHAPENIKERIEKYTLEIIYGK